MNIEHYSAALNIEHYLNTLAARPRTAPRAAPRDGLAALLAYAGHPERQLRCIHVAGSKGKGTTALLLEAMLQAGGRNTGVFTSPHLQRWNERIRLGGQPVADDALSAVLSELQPRVEALHDRQGNGPDFFEVLLVAALILFRRFAVDEVIIEAGIGARFDATRVVQPVVTALTTVELEHTHLLGDDLAAIAYDKGAIARPGVPLVIGPLQPAAQAVVSRLARAAGAEMEQPQWRMSAARDRVYIDGCCDLPLTAPSRARAECTAIAFACLRALDMFASPEQVAERALAGLIVPGRQEILAQAPLIVADAAHTRASLAALAEALWVWAPPPAPLYLLLSCSGERDLATLAAPLLRRACRVIVTRADASRSDDPAAVAAELRRHWPELDVQLLESPRRALEQVGAQAPENGVICATGSVYMAGVACGYWRVGDHA